VIVVAIGVAPVGITILTMRRLRIGSTRKLVGTVAQIAIVAGWRLHGHNGCGQHEHCGDGDEDLLHARDLLLTIEWDIHSRGAPSTDQAAATTQPDLVVVARTRRCSS
jgi:hypothetical protein